MWHLKKLQQTSKPLQTKNDSLSGEWLQTGSHKFKLYAAVIHWNDLETITQAVK